MSLKFRSSIFRLLPLLLLGLGQAAPAEAVVLRDAADFTQAFREAGVEGALVVFDLDLDVMWFHNRQLAERGFPPASTFKIPNSLIALETGVVSGPDSQFPWDGKKTWNPNWNRDHHLASAFENSVVWVFQQIAREIGAERMAGFLKQLKYGNRTLAGAVDTFWLDGGLRISAVQQIEFLQRLYFGELPVDASHQKTVKSMIILEEGPGYVLRGKTGWAAGTDPDTGWFVGWLETRQGIYFFANLLQMQDERDARHRKTIVLKVLRGRGWMPPETR